MRRWALCWLLLATGCRATDPASNVISPDLPPFEGAVGYVSTTVSPNDLRYAFALRAGFSERADELPLAALHPYLSSQALGCEPMPDIEGCKLISCGDGAMSEAYPTAGTISVNGVPHDPDPETGLYPGLAWAAGSNEFSGGDLLTVEGAGGEVPAFSAQIPIPLDLALTAPEASDATLLHPVSEALEVAWSDVSDLPTVVTIAGNVDPYYIVASCAFDSAAGAGVVPRRVLRELEGADGWLEVDRFDIATFQAGAFTVAGIGRAHELHRTVSWEP